MPREQWDALVRGEDCPTCHEVAGTIPDGDAGYFVADLTLSRLRLARNQFIPGYCVLLCHRHVREAYELDPDGRSRFFEDMLRAGRALEDAFGAIKLNFEILGNAVPHLHARIKPCYYGDPAPNRSIDQNAGQVFLTPNEHAQRVDLIPSTLESVKVTVPDTKQGNGVPYYGPSRKD